MEPKVSVIIPAYNEEDVITDCLASLVDQSFQDYQVFIIDDASTDSTKEIIQTFCAKYPNKIFLREYGKVGPGKARNLTAYACGSEFLVFMDADCIATPNWIEKLLSGYTSPEIGSSGGPHLAPPSSNPFQRKLESTLRWVAPSIDFYKEDLGKIREVAHNPLCNVSYRRDVFMRLRGFREDLFPGEDVELDLRVLKEGFKIHFVPSALVYHHRPENIQAWNKVMHAYGRAQGKLVRESGVSRRIQMIGILWILGLVALAWGLFQSFGWIGLAGYSVFLWLHFFFRPLWNNQLGIWIHLMEWLNGFIRGFITKRSPPPGSRQITP